MSNFSLLDTLNGSRWDTSTNNINTVGYVSCNGGTALGTYYSNNGSAFRVPNGTTASRPSPGYAGYLRFNTDQSYNCLEYYDPLSTLWTPIYPIPTITSITPDYVTDTSGAGGYYNTNPLIVSGYGYVPGCSVSYRGTDSSVYSAPNTTYVSSTQLNATVPASVYNGYNQDPFTIIVTNPTGVSGFLLNALDVDPSASWVTPAGAITNSLGGTTVDSSFALTTTSSPYFRVQAIDLEGLSLTYNSPDLSLNSATSKCTITTSGGYGYITGTPYSLANATVSFTINALDGRTVVPRNFSLTVNAALRSANVSSANAYQITYTDSNGLNPRTLAGGGPYPNGYTIYTFNPNASSQVLAPTSPQSVNTYQDANVTYAFTPLFTSNTFSILVVGGGGAGAGDGGSIPPAGNGGGGGGGVLYNNNTLTMNNGVTYTITVGAGAGIGLSPTQSQRLGGGSSIISGSGFTTLTANGGGGGGYWTGNAGQAGGCGGGGAQNAGAGSATQTSIGSATGAGNAGAAGSSGGGGGGGGAGAAASNTNGGAGILNTITGNSYYYGGGGGGTGNSNGSGGSTDAGGGSGTAGATNPSPGQDGRGGGSGAQISGGNTARGGSGVVIIRFKSYSG